MTKMNLVLVAFALGFTAPAFADNGEGLSAPAPGTCDALAYTAANRQYQKDNGNPAIHLEGLKLVDGGTTYDTMTIEIDFYSAEDGAYSYDVKMAVKDGACTKAQVKRISQ